MAKFQTSFIPKKQTPVKDKEEKKRRGGLGLLGFIALVILLLSLIGTGGLYLYKIVLDGNIEQMSQSISRVQQAIDPELIARLKDVDARIETAKLLLSNRTVISPVFRLLEDSTLRSVGYQDFKYAIDDNGEAVVQLSGAAEDYASLALQSDVFGETAEFQEPIFGDLSLDQAGNVEFSFKTPIERGFILYENNYNVIPRFTTDNPSGQSLPSNTESGSTGTDEGDGFNGTTEDLDELESGIDELLNELNF